ncbi:MAG: xanthine dehydrogenase family protein molybdopterin-binding subunit [Candidatus Tectomicrobia bacterium]|nr:xanthine dehydrogenase family protein molybdopterin-binding subunit [Candidatus Tectomicrobia bacterium]
MQNGALIGARVLRKEDPRLLRGEGCYVADLRFENALHAAMVRSQHAHARLTRLDAAPAARLPGVTAVVTAADLGAVSKPLPQSRPHAALRSRTYHPLARQKVKYVGEVIAVVLAASRYTAEDAAEAVLVDYEPLPAITSAEQSIRADAAVIHDDYGDTDNIAAHLTDGYGDVAAALAQADLVFKDRLRLERSGGQAIETRGVAACYDEASAALTVWSATQQPHFLRGIVSTMLEMPESSIRVVAPDVGGAFGAKATGYVEEVLAAFLSRRFQRPVIWIEDRRESLTCCHQEHEQVHDFEVGARRDGRIVALRNRLLTDTGAYAPKGLVVPVNTASATPGPYRVPNYAVDLTVTYSNRVPVAPVRGAGRPQAAAVMETIINRVARELRLDPMEVRRINLLQPRDFPYECGLRVESGNLLRYDSGNYPGLLEKILREIGYEEFRREQARDRERGVYRGIGVSLSLEATGMGPFEGARIRLDRRGAATVYTGAAAQGQGSATTIAQVTAAYLGLPMDEITVIAGDTSMISRGCGAYASRIAAVAASAAKLASEKLLERLAGLAAEKLEASPKDIELRDGHFRVRGMARPGVSLRELVLEHGDMDETAYFETQDQAWSGGAQAAIVEVDTLTGTVRLVRHAVVHDCGVVLNPMIVEGQVLGGIAHGIGETLFERTIYDERGQYLSASFMDYLMPTANDIPPVSVAHQETPSPNNPLGVKGAGEGGTIGVCGAVLGAIEDALGPFGVTLRATPVTSEALLNALRQAAGSRPQATA